MHGWRDQSRIIDRALNKDVVPPGSGWRASRDRASVLLNSGSFCACLPPHLSSSLLSLAPTRPVRERETKGKHRDLRIRYSHCHETTASASASPLPLSRLYKDHSCASIDFSISSDQRKIPEATKSEAEARATSFCTRPSIFHKTTHIAEANISLSLLNWRCSVAAIAANYRV